MAIKFCHIIDASTANPLLFNSVKYSDRSKYDYSVITFNPAGELYRQMEQIGVRSLSVQHRSNRDLLRTIWRIYRYLRKEKIRIVQVHGFAASPVGLLAAKLAGVPVRIFSGHHSHEVPLYGKKLLSFVDSFTAKHLATNIIAPSSDMKEVFLKYHKIPDSKISVIHHGFDLEDWKRRALSDNEIRNQLQLHGKIVFGAVGRLFWVKDFDTLIKAFAKIAENKDNTVLLIAGEGSGRETLTSLIHKLKLESRVYLLGKREDMASVMNTFDVFIHTAIAESFGLVFVEAFALGKPVISTRTGVAPEIIEDKVNGFIVRKKDPEMLAHAMLGLLKMKDAWNSVATANIQIAERFAVQLTQAEVDATCEKWLQKRK